MGRFVKQHNPTVVKTKLPFFSRNIFLQLCVFSVSTLIINGKPYFRDISHPVVAYIQAVERVSPVEKHWPRGIRRAAVGNPSLSLSGKRLDRPGVGDLELGRSMVTSVFQMSEDMRSERKDETVYSVCNYFSYKMSLQ
jgi:hypothetical protein